MTIKKTLTVKRPTVKPDAGAQPGAPAEAPQSAAATIADRFRLDAPEAPKRSSGGGAGVVTLCAAVVALVVAGILTFVLYQHWEFLKGA